MTGDKIQQLRKEKGLSQEQLATQLHVSRQAISKWELGESMPDTDNIIQLASFFGVSTDSLLKATIADPKENPAPKTLSPSKYNLISFAIMAVGLIIALIGWQTWQTLLSVGVGFAVQIAACLFFEISSSRRTSHSNVMLRKRFYAIAVWFLCPIPSFILTFYIFSLIPRAYSSALPAVCALLIYILAAFITTKALQKSLHSS